MNIQKLKGMIAEPAGKEWFQKHGTPKVERPKKQSSKSRALLKLKK